MLLCSATITTCTSGRAWALAAALVLAACDVPDAYIYRDGGTGAPDTGPSGNAELPCPKLTSAADVLACLDGKTLSMQGDQIPADPNGYDENVNYGQASQCLYFTHIAIGGGTFNITTRPGTLNNAPHSGDHGQCDRSMPGGTELSFNTTSVLIENVREGGTCFDLTLTYAGFGQEGRGAFSEDRSTVSLELYFRDQAVGHRCAAGAVGAPTVTLNQEPFAGNAVQIYSVN